MKDDGRDEGRAWRRVGGRRKGDLREHERKCEGETNGVDSLIWQRCVNPGNIYRSRRAWSAVDACCGNMSNALSLGAIAHMASHRRLGARAFTSQQARASATLPRRNGDRGDASWPAWISPLVPVIQPPSAPLCRSHLQDGIRPGRLPTYTRMRRVSSCRNRCRTIRQQQSPSMQYARSYRHTTQSQAASVRDALRASR